MELPPDWLKAPVVTLVLDGQAEPPSAEVLRGAERVVLHAPSAAPNDVDAALRRLGSKLRYLALHTTSRALSEVVTTFTKLRGLRIVDETLPGLPSSIGALAELRTLELVTFHLGSLPKAIGALTELRALSIDSHHFFGLPNAFSKLEQLELLELWMRRVIVPDWEKPAYFACRFEQPMEETFGILAKLPALRELALGEPPGDLWCPTPVFSVLPESLTAFPALETLRLADVYAPVRFPLKPPPTLKRVRLNGVRLESKFDEVREAWPDVEFEGQRALGEYLL